MKAIWAVLSFGAVYYAGQGGSYFQSLDWILRGDHLISETELLSSTFLWCCLERGNRLLNNAYIAVLAIELLV